MVFYASGPRRVGGGRGIFVKQGGAIVSGINIAVERDILELSRLLRERADPFYVSDLTFAVRNRLAPEGITESSIEQIVNILKRWPPDRVDFLLEKIGLVPERAGRMCGIKD